MKPTSPSRILIVDDSPLCREMVAKTLASGGLAGTTAVDGIDGIARLSQESFEAVILDNEMPNMDGLSFLKTIRSDARWKSLPVVMLTTTVAKEVIMEATRYGINGYILKARLSMADLLARVRHAISKPVSTKPPTAAPPSSSQAEATSEPPSPSVARISIPNMVPRETTLEAVTNIAIARTLSGVVTQLVAAADSSSKVSMTEVAAVVKQDPVLCVRVVQLACSAAYGGSKVRLGSVDEAVRIVGITPIRDLAVSMALMDAVPVQGANGVDLLRCWHHAIAVGSVMGRIVPRNDAIPAGLPYLIGLCHDLPEILLRQHFPTEYAAAVDFALQTGVAPNDVVKSVFGIPYGDIAEVLFDRLRLPAAISAPIKEFQMAANASVGTHRTLLSRALSIANCIAHGAQATSSTSTLVTPVLQADCRTALIPDTAINAADIKSESLTLTCILAEASAEAEEALMSPLLRKRDLGVCYVRDPAFAALDPLEVALGNLCKTVRRESLPGPTELAGFRGLVVASSRLLTLHSEAKRNVDAMSSPLPTLSLLANYGERTSTASGRFQTGSLPISIKALSSFVERL